MKKILAFALILVLGSCTNQDIMKTVDAVNGALGGGESSAGLTNSEVIQGLKNALDIGIGNATKATSKTDGFFKNPEIFIPFPPEAIKVKNKLSQLGMDGKINSFVTTLNRSAEEASREAGPIFLSAIKNMSIADGFKILKGSDGAATNFLKANTLDQLRAAFSPKVKAAISKVNLTSKWDPLASAYNTATMLTGGEQVNPNLDEYVTEKAIEGLFVMMAKEEKQIRKDPDSTIDLNRGANIRTSKI